MEKKGQYPSETSAPEVLRDVSGPLPQIEIPKGMVRTQIYLTRSEHGFLLSESARRGEPMAAVIRGFIEDKMRMPESAWASNPMLEPTPQDDALELPEDAAINHDHYLSGAPKKYVKKRGQWVLDEAEARQ